MCRLQWARTKQVVELVGPKQFIELVGTKQLIEILQQARVQLTAEELEELKRCFA